MKSQISSSTLSLISALGSVGGQRRGPAALPSRKRPSTHCTRGWVGPRAGLDGCGKSRPPPGFDPRTVQPVASRYTDCAIPAHSHCQLPEHLLTLRHIFPLQHYHVLQGGPLLSKYLFLFLEENTATNAMIITTCTCISVAKFTL